MNTCPSSVTGSYQVENWRARKVRWPHIVQCDFPLPAKDGLVDLLIGVDFADLQLLIPVETLANRFLDCDAWD